MVPGLLRSPEVKREEPSALQYTRSFVNTGMFFTFHFVRSMSDARARRASFFTLRLRRSHEKITTYYLLLKNSP